MAEQIRPRDLIAGTPSANAALIFDDGTTVRKGTPVSLVDAATPLASQLEAEAGVDNAKRVTPLRVRQAIYALGITQETLTAPDANKGAGLVAYAQGQSYGAGTTGAALNKVAPYFNPAASDLAFAGDVQLLTLGARRMRGGYGLSGISNGWTENDNQSPFKLGAEFNMQNAPGVDCYILNGVLATFRIETGIRAPNTGSTITFASHNAIWDANDGENYGWREYSQHIGSVRAKVGRNNAGGNYWLCDWTVAGPAFGTDTTKREQFMGAVMFARKQTLGTAIGLDPEGTGKRFWGSCVLTLGTLPTIAGGGADGNDNIPTYTMNAGLDVHGWAGPYGTSSGDASGALAGFIHGVKVGGQPVSAWTNFGVRSKMTNGVYIQDATEYGLKVENLYPGATGAYIALPGLGAEVTGTQTATSFVTLSGSTVAVFSEFRRHTGGTSWTQSEFRLRSQIDTNEASGAYLSLRNNANSQTDVAVGFGKDAPPKFYLRSGGELQLSPIAAPSAPADGTIWYDSTVSKFRGRAAGATVDFH